MFLLAVLASERVWIGFDVEPNMLSCHQAQCPRQAEQAGHPGSPQQFSVDGEILRPDPQGFCLKAILICFAGWADPCVPGAI